MKSIILAFVILSQVFTSANAEVNDPNKAIRDKFKEKVFNAMMMGTFLKLLAVKNYSDLQDRDKLCFELGVAQGEGVRVLDIGLDHKSLWSDVINQQLSKLQTSYHGFNQFCGMGLGDVPDKRGYFESLKENLELYTTPLELIYKVLNKSETNNETEGQTNP